MDRELIRRQDVDCHQLVCRCQKSAEYGDLGRSPDTTWYQLVHDQLPVKLATVATHGVARLVREDDERVGVSDVECNWLPRASRQSALAPRVHNGGTIGWRFCWHVKRCYGVAKRIVNVFLCCDHIQTNIATWPLWFWFLVERRHGKSDDCQTVHTYPMRDRVRGRYSARRCE
jgi:hypothetical protein